MLIKEVMQHLHDFVPDNIKNSVMSDQHNYTKLN